jgi:hypothetical protein
LNTPATDTYDTLVVGLGNVKRYFGRKLLLEKGQTLQDRAVRAGDIYQEVMVVEGLELDFHVGSLHNLVDFAILLPADELPMFVGKFNLEPYLMVERLTIPVSAETPGSGRGSLL